MTNAVLAATCFSLCIWGVCVYPILTWPLLAGLMAYAVGLWRRPALFLIILPIVLPAFDLGLWTGWMEVGESDLFVLLTLAVLLLRSPPHRADLLPSLWPGVVLLLLIGSFTVSLALGLASPLGAAHSDNALLRPDNAIRIGTSLAEALALLPFVRQRQRCHGDGVTMLGWGLAAGLGVVALIVVSERILFAGILDFSTAYRVAGPFSSMRVGGGHIGAYAALVLPFCLCLFHRRPRWMATTLGAVSCALGSYTLIVTFARTAYAAGMVAVVITALGWLWSADRIQFRGRGLVPVGLLLCVLTAIASLTGMQTRFAASAADLLTRQDNWSAGLAVRDGTVSATLFGMGLGSYPRAMLMRSRVNRPSDLVLRRDGGGVYASMLIETPFFLGQKISLPQTGDLHLALQARSPDSQGVIGTMICDKVLLYSDNCRGLDTKLLDRNEWISVRATFASEGLGGRALFGLLRRPVELSVSGPTGHVLDVRDVRLTDDDGRSLLVNGNFAHGLDRWIFTDDSHVSWRMLNEYLMLFFETGVLGLAAFCALAGLAMAGGIHAIGRGDATGAAVTGSVAGFLISSLFDNVLEAPRVATLFFLICWCGLMQWDAGSSRQ